MDFIKLIRFPNLLIIVVIQTILQYKILRPALIESNIDLLLSPNLFILLVFSTVIIAATGFIINDIMDVDIDKINKPSKMIVERVISLKHAWQIYWVLVVFGFIISFYVAYRISNLPLVLIYPSAILLLALYSIRLKRMLFIGNFVVAVFSALVTGIILFAERESFALLQDNNIVSYKLVSYVFYGYMIFSVLTSLYRELVKDLEDIEGDRKEGCKTIPTVFGVGPSKITSALFGLATAIVLIPWIYDLLLYQRQLLLGAVLICVLAPLLYTLIRLLKAKTSTDFHHISTSIKILMAGGIFCLLLI